MKIVLTFDIERDLPQVVDTFIGITKGIPKILKLLEEFDIKATFFCTGNIAHNYASYIELIESNGHEIACHGWNHERLTNLGIEKIYEHIKESKLLLEEACQNSKIIGFRAPYLSISENIFEILQKLGFKYDSSITSLKKAMKVENKYHIKEFVPSKKSGYLRFGIPSSRVIPPKSQTNVIILYFHPWEFLNMKELILERTNKLKFLGNLLFRPDRWLNTGLPFEVKLRNLINYILTKKMDFMTLEQLYSE
jgi:peptidoglycan/xylan/chitin deacetylase (PgdA/CDA1 family)